MLNYTIHGNGKNMNVLNRPLDVWTLTNCLSANTNNKSVLVPEGPAGIRQDIVEKQAIGSRQAA